MSAKNVVALIPARGGSKGIPGKNIRMLNGKPLIAWSIGQGLASRYVNEVVVSTDDKEIAAIARQYGASVPFMRPAELATDEARTVDVIFHALDFFSRQGNKIDILVLLEPTSPLRESLDIDNAIDQLLANKDAESIVGICKAEAAHPDFLVTLSKGGFIKLKDDFSVKRRQDLAEDYYFFEGSVYAFYSDSLYKRNGYYHKKTLGYVVPKWKSFEVDEPEDFLIIEAIMQNIEKFRTLKTMQNEKV